MKLVRKMAFSILHLSTVVLFDAVCNIFCESIVIRSIPQTFQYVSIKHFVGTEGLEPSQGNLLAPKASASANSATCPRKEFGRKDLISFFSQKYNPQTMNLQ